MHRFTIGKRIACGNSNTKQNTLLKIRGIMRTHVGERDGTRRI